MATLDIASKGPPHLIYSTSILASFLHEQSTLHDIKKDLINNSHINGSAVVLKLPDGSTFKDEEVIEYMSKLATPGSTALSTVSHSPKQFYIRINTRQKGSRVDYKIQSSLSINLQPAPATSPGTRGSLDPPHLYCRVQSQLHRHTRLGDSIFESHSA